MTLDEAGKLRRDYRSIAALPGRAGAWLAAGSRLRLSGEESAHLVRSLRARRGDSLVLLDGEGHLLEGKLESADGEGSVVEVTRTRTVEAAHPSITVAQGMPKGGTMDDLVRGVCEAGASEVIPLETARCEVKLDADRARTRTTRWQQQAVEACKQSGHPWLAHIALPTLPLAPSTDSPASSHSAMCGRISCCTKRRVVSRSARPRRKRR